MTTVTLTGDDDRVVDFVAIVFVDLGGTEALQARRDDGLRQERLAALRSVSAEHGGREVRTTAGGLMLAFPSAVAAVHCAVALQRLHGTLRIGIGAGEPGGDLSDPHGMPMLVADGLCAGARDGEIVASDVVRQIVAPRGGVTFRAAGTVRLSGLEDRVATACVVWDPDAGGEEPAAEAPRAISVVIVDDEQLLRAGFRVILESEPDITVVGEAPDGRAALDVIRRRTPDVVLMDIRMPELDGLQAAEQLLADPAVTSAVIMLTTFDTDQYVYDALRIGASGFLLKDTPADRLLDAIRVAAAGEALLAPAITRRLIDRFTDAAHVSPGGVPEAFSALTERELEVLRLIARGLSNSEIAAELVLGENTVKTHVARVLAKLGLRDRVQAVVLAYEAGLSGHPHG